MRFAQSLTRGMISYGLLTEVELEMHMMFENRLYQVCMYENTFCKWLLTQDFLRNVNFLGQLNGIY